jgi:predicted permease
MSLRTRVRTWLRAATFRSRLEREMDEELAFHLESRTQDLIRRGVAPEEAARQARIELGGVTTQKEKMRASLGLRLWDDLRADLLYAARMLAKSPGFTAIAIGSLALGIGANTAIFSMTRTALFENLPVSHPEELRLLHWSIRGVNPPMDDIYGRLDKTDGGIITCTSFSMAAYRNLRESAIFRDLIAYSPPGTAQLSFNGDTESGPVEHVSGNFFSALGLRAQAGRTILPSDDGAAGKSSVAVLSDAYWHSRFARSPAVIGKTIEVNRVPLTIIGVAPRGFSSLGAYQWPKLFVPLSLDPILSPGESKSRLTDPESWWLTLFGRIRPDMSDAQAQAALAGAFREMIHQTLNPRSKIDLNSMRLFVTPGNRGDNPYRHHLVQIDSILSALAFLVLLLACANLANLLLARATARQKEVSLRIALGAGRARILRQAFTENLLLALMGGAAGTALGYVGRDIIPPLVGQPLPKFDGAILVFALVLSLLTCLLFGSLPAWRATHADVQEAMKETAQMTAKRSRTRLGKSLIVAQIALSVILIAGAGLFLQTLRNLTSVPLGFQPQQLLLFNLSLTPEYKTKTARAAAYQQIASRLEAIPGVISASYSTDTLIDNVTSTSNFDITGEPQGVRRAWENIVGPHYLETMGIPLMRGRGFGRQDTPNSQRVAIVNERLAHDFFPGKNAIGQTFNSDHTLIIGICGDTRFKDLRDSPPPTYYLFSRQVADYGPGGQMTFAVKTASNPAAVSASLRRTIHTFDQSLPIAHLRTQQEQIDDTLQSERLFAFLTSGFGLLALVLACIGIYGIMAYTVARRTNEIGIRLALGAQRRQVMTMVVSEALWLVILGIGAGIAAALLLTRSLQSMLFGLKADDPLTYGAAGLLLIGVALLASFVPARAAARVNPIEALRHE